MEPRRGETLPSLWERRERSARKKEEVDLFNKERGVTDTHEKKGIGEEKENFWSRRKG